MCPSVCSPLTKFLGLACPSNSYIFYFPLCFSCFLLTTVAMGTFFILYPNLFCSNRNRSDLYVARCMPKQIKERTFDQHQQSHFPHDHVMFLSGTELNQLLVVTNKLVDHLTIIILKYSDEQNTIRHTQVVQSWVIRLCNVHTNPLGHAEKIMITT